MKRAIPCCCGMVFVALGMAAISPTTPLAMAQEAGKDGAADILADGDYKIGPNYKSAPELMVRDDVPKGVMKSFTMDRKESKIFPIDPKLRGNPTRKVSVYVPKQYVPGSPAAFAVIQDASYMKILPTILDNMIYDKRLPVIVPIFVGNGGS